MKILTTYLLMVLWVGILTGCASNLSSDSYDDKTVGQAQTVYYGTIVSAEPVNVKGNSGVGGLAGAAAGGVGAAFIGGGFLTNLLAGIGGALVGGLIGNKVDEEVNSQTAVRYIVQLDQTSTVGGPAGQAVSIVQAFEPHKTTLPIGTRVMILQGGSNPARIVPAKPEITITPPAETHNPAA